MYFELTEMCINWNNLLQSGTKKDVKRKRRKKEVENFMKQNLLPLSPLPPPYWETEEEILIGKIVYFIFDIYAKMVRINPVDGVDF